MKKNEDLETITVGMILDGIKRELITISKDQMVTEAAKMMKDNNIGSILVKNDIIEGIITKGDIIYRVVGKGLDPGITTVGEVYSRPIEFISTNETLETCMQVMSKKNIERILIVENDDPTRPIGLISTNDILRFAPQLLYIRREHLLIELTEESSSQEKQTFEGFCDDCNNFSTELVVVDGYTLCPECRMATHDISERDEQTI